MKVSHHSAKFGGTRQYCSVDITILVCHVIAQEHVIKGSCDFIHKSHQDRLPF